MKMLAARILEAAGEAAENAAPASLRTAFEAVEPIGYNRRTNDFCGVDPWLKAAVLRTRAERIYLLNYACHAVVLGRGNGVSADWPGAWVREMEKSGRRAVFLQGFCGDIDPVTQINRWGKGTPEDLRFNGELLKRRLDKAERFAETQERPRLSAVEKRIRIPLDVWGKGEIERRAASFGKTFARFPGARRFAREWKAVALQKRPGLRKSPFLEGVPIQALAIGGLKMIALPGEIFCGIGLKLRKAFDPLIPVGLANGDIGYVPSRRAYEDRSDYACYCAPMFGPGFPFAPDIEGIILRVSRKMLRAV
jgi:hypothetical protein